MEPTIYNSTKLQQLAAAYSFTALLNSYCREFTNWSRYAGIPRYDASLAAHFETTGHDFHLRFDFSATGSEVFAPVKHFGESGRHLFYFPVVERILATDEIHTIDPFRFVELAAAQARLQYPLAQAGVTQQRLQNSISNLYTYLQQYMQVKPAVNKPALSFIEAEHSLIIGHSVHPLPKGKQGFTGAQLLQYSPETGGQFALHYFLVAPGQVLEQSATGTLPSVILRQELTSYAAADKTVSALLATYTGYTVVPVHPWEAAYLLNQAAVKAMEAAGLLFYLGAHGPLYTATSSVRTVYNANNDWMYKFSLHVKITNSERVNLLRELHRGYDFSRLMQTAWGADLQKAYPEIAFITDPSFISVSYNNEVIPGFNTSIRTNVFKDEAAQKNVTLLAALCQDALPGETPRMVNVLTAAAKQRNKTLAQTAVEWFKQYLHICVRPVVAIFNEFGLACEFHQQNVLVELDSNYFPAKLYFRDNQGFFFRSGKAAQLLQHAPGLAADSGSIIPEEHIIPKYSYYLLINNLMGVVSALGCNGLADELQLIHLIYKELQQVEPIDSTGFVHYMLNSRSISAKGNLLTSLHNMDEASAPIEFPAVYVDFPNPLNKYHFSKKLIKPEEKDIVYSRYFPKEDITIAIRPFDIDRDLEMVHEWFNLEHTRDIWKMDGPIRQLEAFYRMLLPGDHSHSFVGEINGEPCFTFEPYWPMRDTVGAYYAALATDYGAHLLIAPTDKNKKFTFPSTQVLLDYVFAQPEVGKCIGEAAVESRAMHILVTRMGFKHQQVIEMPHKNANLTFCYREWYWEKFPESKDIVVGKPSSTLNPAL